MNSTKITVRVTTDSVNFLFGPGCNDTLEDVFQNPFHILHVKFLFITVFVAVTIACIIGNTMVLFAIARSPRLRSMTNFFLANLAIADLCVGVFCVLPNLSTYLAPNWILGKAMCKIYYYVWNVSYTASIVILTTIAVERYIAIIYPLKSRHFMTRRKLIVVQIIIWFVAIIYNIPYLVFYDIIEFPFVDIEFCYFKEESRSGLKGLCVANIIVWYVLPLGIIGILYYIIGRALWNTAVVSALRLQSFGDSSKNSSIRSVRSHRASRVNSASTQCPDDKQATQKDHQDSQSSSNDDVLYKQDNNIVLFNPRGTLTFICGVQNGSASAQELKCFINGSPARNSSQSDEPLTPLSDDMKDVSTVSYKKPSIRYRQTHIESSRKVARARKKVIRLLTAIVVTFSVCVLPHHVKVLNHYWTIYTLPHEIDVYFSPIAAIVLYLNSALNPILYALFSKNFRKSFKETLPCFRRKIKLKKPSSFKVLCSK